jgi:hypothetical protein
VRYVPRRISEVRDFLGFMVMTCPDDFPPEGNLDLDSAFATLVDGLEAVRGPLGEQRHRDLVRMAGEAKALYEAGDEDGGSFTLQDMKKMLASR